MVDPARCATREKQHDRVGSSPVHTGRNNANTDRLRLRISRAMPTSWQSAGTGRQGRQRHRKAVQHHMYRTGRNAVKAPSLPRIRALLGRGSPSRFALPRPRNADPYSQLAAPLRGHSSATRPRARPCALRAIPLRPKGNCLRDPPPNKPDVQLPLRVKRVGQ